MTHAHPAGWGRSVPPPRLAAMLQCNLTALRPESKPEALAEIDAADIRVGDDLGRPAFRQNASGMDDVGAVDQAERFAHIVVGDEHADAPPGQVADERLDLADRDRVDAGERLVEQHEGRAAR